MDYDKLGLDSRLRAKSALSNIYPPIVRGVDFDGQYQVQTKNIRVSQLVGTSEVATATGGMDNNTSLTISATLNPNKSNNQPNFALPFLAAYIGTSAVGSMQLYPRYGAGIANAKYQVHSGFDYQSWNGTNMVFRVTVENNSGGSQNIFVTGRWKVLGYGYGTSSQG